ncbi:hypothetical protein MKZ38_003874 [Zalerion maritima]|uniref:MARVEL domain-containing protein n=1 Tax=Zalerion maritima TaxID=339359 RepID=A0AAD5RMA5_9PEZI|nr:hypothetical protein MKZ38_003874 [Zalerion maritima]
MQMSMAIYFAVAAAVLCIIELGMTAWLLSGIYGDSPSQISFMLFSSLWSLVIVLPYIALAPLYFPRVHNKIAATVLNTVTMIFWFSGSIALAVLFRGCGSGVYCGTGKAAIAFGFILWALFLVMTVLDALDWTRNRSSPGVSGLKGPHAYPGA